MISPNMFDYAQLLLYNFLYIYSHANEDQKHFWPLLYTWWWKVFPENKKHEKLQAYVFSNNFYDVNSELQSIDS